MRKIIAFLFFGIIVVSCATAGQSSKAKETDKKQETKKTTPVQEELETM